MDYRTSRFTVQQMTNETITLPFTVPDLFAGFAKGTGLAKASQSELTLELVVKDGLLNVLKSSVKEISIPRTEIDSVRLKRGWLGTTMHIRVKSMKWLADLPGCGSGEVTLHVARKDRDRAEDFVQLLSHVP
jgi:hypothetical protein